jgi:hypothetical protein
VILQRKIEMSQLPSSSAPTARPAAKPENLLVNLGCNVAIPAIIMAQLSKETRLGPAWGLVVALLFPLGYGIYDLIVRKKTNLISVLGFVGVLLSGVLGLLKLDGRWFAVKDAAIPSLIGLLLLLSMRTREPLVKTLFFNETIMDLPRVEAALRARQAEAAFGRLLQRCTVLVALAFFASGALAYVLARWLLKSPGGTPEFNAELARMHWLSWPVIVVPSMIMLMVALWRMLAGLRELTGLTSDEVFRDPKKPS